MIAIPYLILALVQALIWLKTGYLAAGGEMSIFMFGETNVFDITGYWVHRGTTGSIDPFTIVNYPLASLFKLLLDSEMEAPFLQKIMFTTLIFCGMYGTYCLTKQVFQKTKDSFLPVFASLFYFFNLFGMSQVFRRFIYGGIFAWAYLPIALYTFISFINKPTIKKLFIFLIPSAIFAPAYSHPAFLLAVWLPCMVFGLVRYLKIDDRQSKFRILKTVCTAIFGWVTVNIWWLYPYVTLGRYTIGDTSNNVSNWESNLASLQGVTKYLSLADILTLKQKFYFGSFEYWKFPFYDSLVGVSLVIFGFIVFVIGLANSRKLKYGSFLVVLTLISWFIVKGTNFPLGYVFYTVLFKLHPMTGILRNSYEKIGSVWVLCYSIFFSLGVVTLAKLFHKKTWRKFYFLTVALLYFGALVYPMWTGEIYSKGLLVRIPAYYQEANDYLNNLKDDGRVLVVPIISDYGVQFDWGENGFYNGVNPAIYYFTKPVLAYNFSDKYSQMQKDFYDEHDYESHFIDYNIKYLLLNEEYDQLPQIATKSAQVREILNKNENTTLLKTFPKMSVYEYVPSKQENYPSHFVIAEGAAELTSYIKLSPTHYRVFVNSRDDSFILTFKESYNKLWKAAVNGENVSEHFEVLEYANAWKIHRQGQVEVDIKLVIWPQFLD